MASLHLFLAFGGLLTVLCAGAGPTNNTTPGPAGRPLGESRLASTLEYSASGPFDTGLCSYSAHVGRNPAGLICAGRVVTAINGVWLLGEYW